MMRYTCATDLEDAIAQLALIEPRFAPLHARHGTPSLRAQDPGLEGLLRIVTDQFLSLSAAAAIWVRVRAQIDPFTADRLLETPHDQLLKLGLSNAKARTFHATASAVTEGTLDFAGLMLASDLDVRRALCALPGVGPWTADIFLLSCLQHADAWPAGDLALQLAAQDVFELAARPQGKAMIALAESWRPHRAAAARLLWSHYRDLKGLTPA